eukprot:scpid56541/ scgid0572/ 
MSMSEGRTTLRTRCPELLLLALLVAVVCDALSSDQFVVIHDVNCRYRYRYDTKNTCAGPRCWMDPRLFQTPDILVKPQSQKLCVVRVPVGAYDLEFFFSLADVKFPSSNCSTDVLSNRIGMYKMLGNGTRLNISQHQDEFQYRKPQLGNASEPWCKSPRLPAIADPYLDKCMVNMFFSRMKDIFKGNWQFVVQPADGAAPGAEPAVHQFQIESVQWTCGVCFGENSQCRTLTYADVYPPQQLDDFKPMFTIPRVPIKIGQSKCIRFESTADLHGGWLLANNATSEHAQPVQYVEQADGGTSGPTTLTVYPIPGVSTYGSYQQCLHIDHMTTSLAGWYFYQFSDAHTAASSRNGTIAIFVEVEQDGLSTAELRAPYRIEFGILDAVLVLWFCALSLYLCRRDFKPCKNGTCRRNFREGTLEEHQHILAESEASGDQGTSKPLVVTLTHRAVRGGSDEDTNPTNAHDRSAVEQPSEPNNISNNQSGSDPEILEAFSAQRSPSTTVENSNTLGNGEPPCIFGRRPVNTPQSVQVSSPSTGVHARQRITLSAAFEPPNLGPPPTSRSLASSLH